MEKYRIKESFEKEFEILDEIGVPTEDIEFLKCQKNKLSDFSEHAQEPHGFSSHGF